MSDNLPPEVVLEELEARLRIPTEVWTDVFKLLPRRFLIQQIESVCYYFKEISNKNVKNVHVIESSEEFTDKLDEDDPVAIEELNNLAGNDCNLVGQFQLTKMWINEKSQVILRHCPDLLNGCKIVLRFGEENKSSSMFLECLSKLEKAKPIAIKVIQHADQGIDFWHHLTFLNCDRVYLTFWSALSAATQVNIFDWLHHQPNGVDCDGSADQQVRCMIVCLYGPDHIDWLINRCSEEIQEAREQINRRPYVLSFIHRVSDWPGYGQFRQIENKATGEVLMPERVMNANGQPTHKYRLRRCLAEEMADGKEFYAGMFKRDEGFDEFNIDESNPKVLIGWD